MTISYSTPIEPFPLPISVALNLPGSGKRQDGLQPSVTLKLSQLPRATVEALCMEFVEAVLAAHDYVEELA